MCSISGLVNKGDERILERMNKLQTHRGPDDSGAWTYRSPDGTWVGLGSQRLAIQDISPAGHMPMSTPDEKLWIVYNGEIYNSPKLREELESRGERFRSRSDTEVLLRLFALEGGRALSRLEGIFSFAVCDLRRARPSIFLARDRLGVKPLYYMADHGGLAFASELKALLEIPDFSRVLRPEALAQFLAFLWVPEPDTLLRGIQKLPAGHYGVFEGGELRIERYWDLKFPAAGRSFLKPERELAMELKGHVFSAVEAQLLSDVPVGAFLSSGLDSSSIVAAMASRGRKVKTYTIAFPEKYRRGEKNLDDPELTERIARHFGTEHRRISMEPEAAALLPRLVWHMDDPVADPAILATYLICREAKSEVKVLLSGVGGDELFGGYRKYWASLAAKGYRLLPSRVRGLIDPMLRSLPPMSHTPFKACSYWARKWGRSASLPEQDQFIMDATYMDERERKSLCRLDIPGDVSARHRKCFHSAEETSWLNRMLYVDCKLFMPSLNLNYTDKMGMANSLEIRVPLLDDRLVEWTAENVPPFMKIKGWTTKYLLRKAMSSVLPEEVLRRPKASFGAPIGYWLEHDLREMAGDLLSENHVRSRGWFEPSAVEKIISEHRSGRKDRAFWIWQLLTLELWAQSFLDAPLSVSRT